MNYLALILAMFVSSQISVFDFSIMRLLEPCPLVSLDGIEGSLVAGTSRFGVALPGLVLPALLNCLSTKLGRFFTEEVGKLAFSGATLGVLLIEGAGPMAFSVEELGGCLAERIGTPAFSGVFESPAAVFGTLLSRFELLIES